jgi:hypothetical protein
MSLKVYELLAAGHLELIELIFVVAPEETRQALISLVRSHAHLAMASEGFEQEGLSLLHGSEDRSKSTTGILARLRQEGSI